MVLHMVEELVMGMVLLPVDMEHLQAQIEMGSGSRKLNTVFKKPFVV